MDSLSNDILLKIFDIPYVQDFRRSVEFSEEPEDKELLGFEGHKMIFKKDSINNSIQTYEKSTSFKSDDTKSPTQTEANSKETQHSNCRVIYIEESPKICKVSNNSLNTSEKQEAKVQKVVLEPKGKKFLFLNGQKLQIIKHSPNVIQSKADTNLAKKLPTLVPKPAPNVKNNPKTAHIVKRQSPYVYTNAHQNVFIARKNPVNILPKFSGKIVAINKSSCPPKLSNIMKEVGGTIRLVNTVSSSNQGNPLIKDISSSTSVWASTPRVASIKGQYPRKMEKSQCSCKYNTNLVSVSTNTEQVKTVTKEVQTEQVFQNNQVNRTSESGSPLGELFSSDVIIGDDVNMGHGPPGLFAVNEKRMKIQFFQDLQLCLKWDSGKLPIHKAVINQDLKQVKSQCTLLKIRKTGVNIPDNNNYTPLQLAILSNVNSQIVQILLENEADMSVLDSEGNNILHLAVEHNRNDLVNIFLEKLESSGMNIDHFNYEGLTPLMICALLKDRIDMAEQLIKHKAELNLRDRKSGRSAIFHAAVSHNASMVLLLLDYGADTKIRNFFGTSVHDAMFELDDIPNEIKYPILGRDLKVTEKRKLNQQDNRKQERRIDIFKKKKLEMITTFQKLESKAKLIITTGNFKK